MLWAAPIHPSCNGDAVKLNKSERDVLAKGILAMLAPMAGRAAMSQSIGPNTATVDVVGRDRVRLDVHPLVDAVLSIADIRYGQMVAREVKRFREQLHGLKGVTVTVARGKRKHKGKT